MDPGFTGGKQINQEENYHQLLISTSLREFVLELEGCY